MLLRVFDPPECEPRVVAENPALDLIASTVLGLEWGDITFVALWHDDDHLMCGSGSLPHGFAATYREGAREYLSERPLESLEEMVALFQSYGGGDNKWRETIGWNPIG